MPEKHQVRITSRAAQDIASICGFIERDSPQNAASVAQELVDSIDSLALFPNRFKVHERRSDASKTVHSMPVPPFIVYYRVVAEHRVVEIITVRHGHQRQPRRFR